VRAQFQVIGDARQGLVRNRAGARHGHRAFVESRMVAVEPAADY
jgi:hypothetical protein